MDDVQTSSWLPTVQESCNMILPGFRFHPTDEELVGFYLRRKVEKKDVRIEFIQEMDIYKYHPWDLPRQNAVHGAEDNEWYFFCMRRKKYRNSVRPNRVTDGSGFWKATGIDQKIRASGDDCIGLKKCLVYYLGRSSQSNHKTDWMMHEFRFPQRQTSASDVGVPAHHISEAETWTICRIFKRTGASSSGTTAATKRQHRSPPPGPNSCSNIIDEHQGFLRPYSSVVTSDPAAQPVHDEYRPAVMDPGYMRQKQQLYQYQDCCHEAQWKNYCDPTATLARRPPPDATNFMFPGV